MKAGFPLFRKSVRQESSSEPPFVLESSDSCDDDCIGDLSLMHPVWSELVEP